MNKMWSTIIGHQRQIEQLKRSLAAARIANAYLFSGLSGIGKRLVAEAFVLSVFCSESPAACGQCVPCLKIKSRTHPDVFFVEPKTEKILIEQMRELQQNLQFYPLEGGAKFAIINDADKMTEAAANSLLKIIEEPPSETHFILISAFPHRLLPTIRSRCQKIAFSPLPEADVGRYIMAERGLQEQHAQMIARLSQGSIGAVSLFDPEFISDVVERLENLLKGANSADIISTAELWSKEADRAPLVIDLIMRFYRDLLIGSVGKKSNETLEKLERNLKTVASVREALLTAANKQLLFEQLLFNLTS